MLCLKRALALLVLALLSACANRQLQVDDSLASLQLFSAPSAWLLDDTLVLRFEPLEGRPVYAVAAWQRDKLPVEDYSHVFARLEYVDNDWPDGLQRSKAFNNILVSTADHWQNLVGAMLEDLVPKQSNQGLYLLVQRSKIVVYRDDSGQLISVPLEHKPDTVTIAIGSDHQSFLERVAATLETYLKDLNVDRQQFLFATTSPGSQSKDYILVDLAQRRLVSIGSGLPGSVVDELGLVGFAAQGLGSIVWRSHVLTFIKNPFTSIGRLINFAFATTVNLVIPRPYLRPATPELNAGPGMDLLAWEQDLDRMVSTPAFPGQVEFLIDGEAFFQALIDDVLGANTSVDFRIYIFDRDDYAVEIADLLKERSFAVKIRVLIDDMGSLFAGNLPPGTPLPPDFVAPMSIVSYLVNDSKVTVRRATNPWFTADHTKTLIIDDRIAYTGGMNIGREYRYEWHDMMMRIQGPVVAQISREFSRAWAHAGPGGDFAYAWTSAFLKRSKPVAGEAGMAMIRPLYTKTAKHELLAAQVAAIKKTRSYVYIQNAYLTDNRILGALVDARRRGVDVRVILPTLNDSEFMAGSNIITANTLIKHGVRVYAYPGMSHIKAAIYDGWAVMGSANFDKLSFYINQEMSIATSDAKTVDTLRRELFETDFLASTEILQPIKASWADYLYEVLSNQF